MDDDMSFRPRWQPPQAQPRVHGGPDARGPVPHDFSSNANAAGPLPSVLRAVQQADRSRYPDPRYQALREALGGWHGVSPQRIVPAASGSAFIQQITRAAAAWAGVRRVSVPSPGYGDYADAARASGLERLVYRALADALRPQAGELWWVTEPSSPDGTTAGAALVPWLRMADAARAVVVVDAAYQPLRLDGAAALAPTLPAWQLWSPNKACGLTGVRGAYAIAPPGAEAVAEALVAESPSWALGAEGVAMLQAFATAPAQAELAEARARLAEWRAELATLLQEAGWAVGHAQSVVPFFCAWPPKPVDLAALRSAGVQLRDTASMGLPGAFRLSAQPPASLQALRSALALQRAERRAGTDRRTYPFDEGPS